MSFNLKSALCTLAALSFAPNITLAQDCGSADVPCYVADGTYHMTSPDTDTPNGIVVHLHGGGGTGKGLLNSGLAKAADERGYVFVAPNGEHPDSRFTRNWSVRADTMTFARDDIEFLTDVLADVRDRANLPDAPVLLAGFSRGGSMAWDVACFAPDFATAYAPMAGAFWDTLPTECEAPVQLFHTHGWNDRTVPLEGRSLREGTVIQGDVWASLKILRETNGCVNRQPETNSFSGDYWLRHWTDCEEGRIDLLLHQGGHGAPSGWSGMMLDWFEQL